MGVAAFVSAELIDLHERASSAASFFANSPALALAAASGHGGDQVNFLDGLSTCLRGDGVKSSVPKLLRLGLALLFGLPHGPCKTFARFCSAVGRRCTLLTEVGEAPLGDWEIVTTSLLPSGTGEHAATPSTCSEADLLDSGEHADSPSFVVQQELDNV